MVGKNGLCLIRWSVANEKGEEGRKKRRETAHLKAAQSQRKGRGNQRKTKKRKGKIV